MSWNTVPRVAGPSARGPALLLQAADDVRDTLLGVLHVLRADIGGDLQVVPDVLSHTGGHVGEQLTGGIFVGDFEDQHQIPRMAVLNGSLHGAVVYGDDVLEPKHPLADLVSQLLVIGRQAMKDVLVADPVDVVHDSGHIVDAAHHAAYPGLITVDKLIGVVLVGQNARRWWSCPRRTPAGAPHSR